MSSKPTKQDKCRVCDGTGNIYPPAMKGIVGRISCATCNGSGITESKEPKYTDAGKVVAETEGDNEIAKAYWTGYEDGKADEPTQDNDKAIEPLGDYAPRNDRELLPILDDYLGKINEIIRHVTALEAIPNNNGSGNTTAPMPSMPDLEAIDTIFWPHPFSGEGKPTQVAISGHSGKVFVLNWHTFNLAIQALISDRLVEELTTVSDHLDDLHQGTEGAGWVHYGEMGEWLTDRIQQIRKGE